MKKFVAAAIAALLVIGFVGTVAAGPAQGINNKGKTEQLYLFEKDPGTWEIVENGAWGKMSFKVRDGTEATEKFVFNGHLVTPMTGFGLIYYPDPWPGAGLLVLGIGTSDEFGDVHIAGDFDFDGIPFNTDPNKAEGGAKIWLVPTDNYSTDPAQMTAWNPAEYLFEYQLI